jgi:hypothetical protein
MPTAKASRHMKGRFRECSKGFVMVFIVLREAVNAYRRGDGRPVSPEK